MELAWASAALMGFAGLMNVPICCTLTVSAGGKMTARIGPFSLGLWNQDKAAQFVEHREKMRTAAAAAWRVRHDLHAQRMRLRLIIGTGDAAQTAMLSGTVALLCGTLNLHAHIEPDFSAHSLEISGSGMLTVRLGHAMWAGLHFLWILTCGKVMDSFGKKYDGKQALD